MLRQWIQRPGTGYALAVVGTALATVVRWWLDPILGDSSQYDVYYFSTALAAMVGGRWPGLAAMALGAAAGTYFFAYPPGLFKPIHAHDVTRLLLFIGIAIIIDWVGGWARASRREAIGQAEDAGRRAREADELVAVLRQSEEEFRAYFDNAAVGAAQLDMTGRFVRVNDRYCQITGYSREELLRMCPWDITHPDDCQSDQERYRRFRDAETPVYESEKRYVRKDGRVIWVQVTAGQLIHDSHGRPLRTAGIIQEVTERKRAEEELKAARDAAELANRSKDHFLAILSHELRTPLTPVQMAVSMLQDRPDLDATTRETLEIIRRNVEMEARLIDDLLDVTRIARGKTDLHKQRVEVCTVIRRAIEVCKPDIEARGLHFDVDLGPAAPYWIEADVPRLQQVFWNLLKNAVKFTPHGGCVGIRVRKDEGLKMKDEGLKMKDEGGPSSFISHPSSFILVDFNDSGIGIEPEALSRIFNAFEQAERSITRQFGGLGLGLTISKALVEMHGGTIEAQSEGRDKGATFRIRLPLSAPAGRPEQPAPAAPPHRVLRSLRILLVEDHGVTAKMMRWVLTEDGHDVKTAGDVATALELAEQNAFDLLVSDLGLPDGSGHDLMRQLRQRGYEFPAIALSGYGQEEDIQNSHEAGFAAHLTKPASRERLLEAVASVTAAELATHT